MNSDNSQKPKDKFSQSLLRDSRMIERYIKNGILSEEELQAHLSQLPDSATNIERMSTEEFTH